MTSRCHACRSDRKPLLPTGPAATANTLTHLNVTSTTGQTPDVQSGKASQAADTNFAHLRVHVETAHTADDSHSAKSADAPSQAGNPEGSETGRPARCADDQQAQVSQTVTFKAESAQTDGDKVPGISPSDSTHWQPGSVRKLFDKELDNHHEEALLLAQLAAQQLRSVLQRDSCCAQHVEEVCSWTVTAAEVSRLTFCMPVCLRHAASASKHWAVVQCPGMCLWRGACNYYVTYIQLNEMC